MNTKPTEASVRSKLNRPGALFAADEVRVLVNRIDGLREQVNAYREARNDLVKKYVGTGSA